MMNTPEISNKNVFSIFQLWLEHLDSIVLKRSLVLALIIGSMLTLVNQSTAVFGDAVFELIPMLLGFMTPFLVIMLSQLGAIQQTVIDRSYSLPPNKSTRFISTIISHNIPFRAMAISLIVGSVSSVIILINTLSETGDITNTPLPQLVQSYVLPFIFGALSQALTYRRCIG